MALSVVFGWRAQDGSSNDPVASSVDASSVSALGTVPLGAALYIESWTVGLSPGTEQSGTSGLNSDFAGSGQADPIHELGFTVEPTPTPVPPTPVPTRAVSAAAVPQSSTASAGALTRDEMVAVLYAAGWPVYLHEQALSVAWCESHYRPWITGDSSRSVGLFQLNLQTWFTYAGEDPAMWADPLVNARTALATYYYDIGKGYAPWAQWSCKP